MTCMQQARFAAAFAVLAGAASLGQAEVVFNGGFETGNFSGWFAPPYVPMQSNFRVQGGGGHSGEYYGQLSSTSLQYLSQILPTEAGTDYELSFWLRRPFNAVTFFLVRWEGQFIFNEQFALPSALEWYEFRIPVTANITGSFLEFGQATYPNEWHIDDVSVIAVPAPGTAVLLTVAAVCALRRRRSSRSVA